MSDEGGDSVNQRLAGQRPELDGVAGEVVAYIEALEAALDAAEERATASDDEEDQPAGRWEPSEAPTTLNLITVTRGGVAKRTPRHLYARQRRGGMGVFGLEANEADPPAFLTLADESAGLILVTDQARAFRIPVRELPEQPVNGRGSAALQSIPLRDGERLALLTPDATDVSARSYLLIVSARGQVRRIGSQYLGRNFQPGTVLYNPAEGGPPAAACWSPGDAEIFIATRQGRAIRFAERQVPVRGCLGLRVEPGDLVVGVATAAADGGVLLLTADGKGAIRLLSGFAANKAPGAGGKVAMKTDALIGVCAVDDAHDVFILSRLGKVIRFRGQEVPPKEGVVQGVNCMNLRADECVAALTCPVAPVVEEE
jgi:DNA gyrase subunit A